jgi:hypothetical protein
MEHLFDLGLLVSVSMTNGTIETWKGHSNDIRGKPSHLWSCATDRVLSGATVHDVRHFIPPDRQWTSCYKLALQSEF